MIGAFKVKNNCNCITVISKSVFSYWPFVIEKGKRVVTVANISLTFSNKYNSGENLIGVNLFFKNKDILNGKIISISETLLDEGNPLSTCYTGAYVKSKSSLVLEKYDGVDNVFVDVFAKYHFFKLRKTNIDCVNVMFSKVVDPGKNIAIRFIFYSDNLFDIDKNMSLHFSNSYLDINCLYKYFSEISIRKFEIPMLTNYDSNRNGGFDVFFYMPLELSGQEFEYQPLARVRPRYDYIGRTTKEPFKKYSWPASRVLGIASSHPKELYLGDGFALSGVFCPRIHKGGFVMGPVDNKGGVMVIGSTINDSSFSVSNMVNNGDIDSIIKELLSLVQELEKCMEQNALVSASAKELIMPYVDAIKVNAGTKNKKLLEMSLDGLRETLSYAGNILPNIAKAADAIKELF